MTSALVAGVVPYCTREDVKAALDYSQSPIADARVDRAVLAASDGIDKTMRRVFYPRDATNTFDWLDHQYSLTWRLWLDRRELAAAPTQVLSNGTDITAACLFRPDDGPPFTRIEINLADNDSFDAGFTYQRAISVVGTFGYQISETPAGTITALGASDTTAVVSNGAALGTGSLIRVDSERMLITAITAADTSQTLAGDLASSAGAVTVPVADGSTFHYGETLLIDSERMFITDIAGNNLTVKRAWNGSVLAAHTTGVAVYALRGVTVSRGQLGSTATTHGAGAAILVFRFPALINQLAVAEAGTNLLQETSGYARAIGSDHLMETIGKGLIDLRKQAIAAHQRKIRTRTAARFI